MLNLKPIAEANMRIVWVLALVALMGCAARDGGYSSSCSPCSSLELEELRIQVADAKRSNNHLRAQVEILEEKLDQGQSASRGLTSSVGSDVAKLNASVDQLEKRQEQIVSDLRQLNQTATSNRLAMEQLSHEVGSQVDQLRTGLKSVVNLASRAQRDGGEYIVQSGDTLEKIARRKGTTVDALKGANQLKNDIIYPRQKLRLPRG